MTHFAKIENGIVKEVLAVTQEVIDTGVLGNPASWVQTSYNTRGGVYYNPNTNNAAPESQQFNMLRANYAGIGFIYDSLNDVFYAPQPYPSWTIGAPDWIWQPPVSCPEDGDSYEWDETTTSWVKVTPTD